MRPVRLLGVVLAAGALWAVIPVAPAQAHPLGNFTVNHYDHLRLAPDEVRLTAVVDRAEIPTAQLLPEIAAAAVPTDAELAAAATAECADVAVAVQVTVDGRRLEWVAGDSTLETVPGAAGLPTLRLTCEVAAAADLDAAAEVAASDSYLTDRIGWREMTADGEGVRLLDSPVPVASVSNELREYPTDLLASPVDVRSFTVATEPGANTGPGASITPGAGDPFTNAVAGLDRRFEDLAGERELTPLVGGLAVLLAVLLGCGHALLPGHGKTVMAAYLAGRRGRSRDAIVVGATVTATHTVGVLVLGLAISVSSSLAGEEVIRWLGVASGLLVAGIGIGMLRAALPRWRAARAQSTAAAAPMTTPALAGAVAGRVPPGRAVDDHPHAHGPLPGDQPGGGHAHGPSGHTHDPGGHTHGPGGHTHGSGGHTHGPGGHTHGPGGHTHGPGGHTHDHGGHTHDHGPGRSGLIGMGVAGGLVPSLSALIVLLASIGLGRTVFGVVLVLAYGLGMAGTLTAVGLLLVRLRDRIEGRLTGRRWTWLARTAPVLTAALVLVVGLSLVVRGVALGA